MAKGKATGRGGKRFFRKGKKAVAKVKKAKAKKNMDTFFLACKYNLMMRAGQGVQVANYFYNVWNLLDPAGAGGLGPWSVHNIPEFKLYATLYDKVRVNSITVRWTPKANVLDQAIGQADSTYNVSGDGMVHTCIDRDGAAPSSITQIRKYSSYRAYSVMKKAQRTYSIKYPTGVWLDCQNLFSDMTLLTRLGATGSITMYAENLLEDNYELINEPWASVELTYNCVFQGKNSAAVSVGEGGSIILTPHTQLVNKAQSPLIYTGFDTFDNSGNLISGNTTQFG